MKRKNNDLNERPCKSRKISENRNSCDSGDQDSSGFGDEEVKEEFVLTKEIADGEILNDICGNFWRIGKPVGKGSFGEIFLAAEEVNQPVTKQATYVAKIEPHSNGPLFVEIHCLLNVSKRNEDDDEEEKLPVGIPEYIASGSHYFRNNRYRFLVLPRFKCDLHSIIKMGRLSPRNLLIIASQTIDVLMHLHGKSYVHSDIKAENLMIGRYKNSAPPLQKMRQLSKKTDDDEDLVYKTPRKHKFKEINDKMKPKIHSTPFSGSNPVRSCRMEANQKIKNSFYEEMVESHYLRHVKPIDYSAFCSDSESTKSNFHFPANSPEKVKTDKSEMTDSDSDFECSFARKKKKKKKRMMKRAAHNLKKAETERVKPVDGRRKKRSVQNSEEVIEDDSEDHVYLIDYGLASKFMDTNGEHRPFCMDQRRAHDGTLEFTSRDAHFGAHSRRSDLECFGYNLIYWSQGYLPWKYENMQNQPPEFIHRLKEIFMADVKEMMKLFYGKDVPKFLGDYMYYVGNLAYDEEPDYNYLKKLFQQEFVKLGYKKDDMTLKLTEIKQSLLAKDDINEIDLMLSNITDLKTVRKLGFSTTKEGAASLNGVNGEVAAQPQVSQTFNIHSASKLSPKYLRSKADKENNKRPKRQVQKNKDKDAVDGIRTRNGKKLSIAELVSIDPDQIARDRAEKEYERFDEKLNEQSPQRYKGRPTYAILEIENRLKYKQAASNQNSMDGNIEKETIKGYTKPMMDVLRKRQLFIEEQIKHDLVNEDSTLFYSPTKRNRDGLRNVLKQTKRSVIYQSDLNRKNKRKTKSRRKPKKQVVIAEEYNDVVEQEYEVEEPEAAAAVVVVPRRRGRPSKKAKKLQDPEEYEEPAHTTENYAEVATATVSRRRPRKSATPKKIVTRNLVKSRSASRSIEQNGMDADDNAVDGTFEEEMPENVPEVVEENENESDIEESAVNSDDEEEFEIAESEEENEELEDDEEIQEMSDEESCNESNVYENESEYSDIIENSENEEASTGEEEETESDDDSIDIKYSPIKTRHTRRRMACNISINQKLRGRRKMFNLSSYDNRNFRTISTRG